MKNSSDEVRQYAFPSFIYHTLCIPDSSWKCKSLLTDFSTSDENFLHLDILIAYYKIRKLAFFNRSYLIIHSDDFRRLKAQQPCHFAQIQACNPVQCPSKPITCRNTASETRPIRHFCYAILDNHRRSILFWAKNRRPLSHSRATHAIRTCSNAIMPLQLENHFQKIRRQMHPIADQLNIQIINQISALYSSKYAETVPPGQRRHTAVEMGQHPQPMIHCFGNIIIGCSSMPCRNNDPIVRKLIHEFHRTFELRRQRPAAYAAVSPLKYGHVMIALRIPHIPRILRSFLDHVEIWSFKMQARHPACNKRKLSDFLKIINK